MRRDGLTSSGFQGGASRGRQLQGHARLRINMYTLGCSPNLRTAVIWYSSIAQGLSAEARYSGIFELHGSRRSCHRYLMTWTKQQQQDQPKQQQGRATRMLQDVHRRVKIAEKHTRLLAPELMNIRVLGIDGRGAGTAHTRKDSCEAHSLRDSL